MLICVQIWHSSALVLHTFVQYIHRHSPPNLTALFYRKLTRGMMMSHAMTVFFFVMQLAHLMWLGANFFSWAIA